MTSSLHAHLIDELVKAGDPERAQGQQKYMKSQLPFHGVRVPEVRRISRVVARAHPIADGGQWEREVLTIWRTATHREQRYGAIELAYAPPYRKLLTPERLPMLDEMVITGAWWDYVDQLAAKHMGHLLANHPTEIKPRLLVWSTDSDIWRRRTAILSQLHFKHDTDLDFLQAMIEPSLAEPEFFLRKAIGWALRAYSKVDPHYVAEYVATNQDRLSPLSRREALKVIKRKG
ncbi:MAG: DNA alkylation repair protein [bacterium]|nr:DNA alkylation repair protein [bacterium]